MPGRKRPHCAIEDECSAVGDAIDRIPDLPRLASDKGASPRELARLNRVLSLWRGRCSSAPQRRRRLVQTAATCVDSKGKVHPVGRWARVLGLILDGDENKSVLSAAVRAAGLIGQLCAAFEARRLVSLLAARFITAKDDVVRASIVASIANAVQAREDAFPYRREPNGGIFGHNSDSKGPDHQDAGPKDGLEMTERIGKVLECGLHDSSARVRARAVALCGSLVSRKEGVRACDVPPLCSRYMSDGSSLVRAAATRLLTVFYTRFGPAAGFPGRCYKLLTSRLLLERSEADARVRALAADAIRAVATAYQGKHRVTCSVTPPPVAGQRHSPKRLERVAIQNHAFAALCIGASDNEWTVRRMTMACVGRIKGVDPAWALQALRKRLVPARDANTGAPTVEWGTTRIRRTLWAGGLAHGWEDENALVRAAAAESVASLAVSVGSRGADEGGARCRRESEADNVLAERREVLDRCSSALFDMVTDPTPGVRSAALRALHRLGPLVTVTPGGLDAIQLALHEGDPAVRSEAAQAAGALCYPNPQSLTRALTSLLARAAQKPGRSTGESGQVELKIHTSATLSSIKSAVAGNRAIARIAIWDLLRGECARKHRMQASHVLQMLLHG